MSRSRYQDLIGAVRAEAEALGAGGLPPDAVAEVIVEAIEARRPRTRYAVGRDAKVMGRLAGVIPDRVLDRLILRRLGLK